MTDRIETLVACAVLMDEQGRCLLNSRPQDKVYGGWWEFPGGKLEAMETAEEAAKREVREELGLDIAEAVPWVTIVHDYPHALVRVHFLRSWKWRGTPLSACFGSGSFPALLEVARYAQSTRKTGLVRVLCSG